MYIPITEVARAVGMHPGSGRRLVKQGRIAAHRVPGARSVHRVDPAEAARFLRASGVDPRRLLEAFGIDPATVVGDATKPPMIDPQS